MIKSPTVERVVKRFELLTIAAAGLLVILAVVAATVVLYVLFAHGLTTSLMTIDSIDDVQTAVQRVFAGVLLLLLGLELLETLKTFFTEYQIRTEVILVVAIIAVGRHIIQLDIEHLSGTTLLGIAALMLSLAASYFLVRRVPPAIGERESQSHG